MLSILFFLALCLILEPSTSKRHIFHQIDTAQAKFIFHVLDSDGDNFISEKEIFDKSFQGLNRQELNLE